VVAGETGLVLEWFGGGRWEFDIDGLPLMVEDGPGTQVLFGHTEGRLVWLEHQGGKRLRVQWKGDRIVGLVCSDGRRVAYRCDDAGNLVEVDGPGGLRRYELDAQGRVVAVLDADGVALLRNTPSQPPGTPVDLETTVGTTLIPTMARSTTSRRSRPHNSSYRR
jgi:YD repeat-containing protein